MHKYFVILLIFLISGLDLRAQDPHFSQFYSANMYVNPALAGIANGPRVSVIYRNQWPGFGATANDGFATYLLSYDQHIEAIRGGIGVSLYSDPIFNGTLSTLSAGLSYSFQLRFSDKLGLKIGLEGVYYQRRLDWFKLLDLDAQQNLAQFSDILNISTLSNEPVPSNLNVSNFDVNFGMVLFNRKHFIGLAVKHILEPDESFTGQTEARLPVIVTLQAGTTLSIGDNRQKDVFLVPNVLFSQQENFREIIGGAILNINFVYGGFYFRHTITNADAVIPVVGFRKNIFRIGYSYDINISNINLVATGGVHELSMTIKFKGDDNSLSPRNRSGILKCPDFLSF